VGLMKNLPFYLIGILIGFFIMQIIASGGLPI
jgi:hypothetical protein